MFVSLAEPTVVYNIRKQVQCSNWLKFDIMLHPAYHDANMVFREKGHLSSTSLHLALVVLTFEAEETRTVTNQRQFFSFYSDAL